MIAPSPIAGQKPAALRPPSGSLGAWILASRPPTLVAAVVPVVIGTAVAIGQGGFTVGPALAALIGAILIQVGTNFANDVFDYEKGADTDERLGPLRAAQAGLLSPEALRRGMALVFGAAVVVGFYLAWVSSPWILAVGAISILAGIGYTGGPYPLGYNGLGDTFVFLFFGFVAVAGTAFVQLGHIPTVAWVAAVPVGALATNLLVVNNVRDLATDTRAGKRTLAVRFGRPFVLTEYLLLTVVSYGAPVILFVSGWTNAWALLPLASIPLSGVLAVRLFRWHGKRLNLVLVGAAQLLLLFGLLFSIGLALG